MLPFRERMCRRASIIRAVRRYFDDQGFLEVDTPVAVRSLAPEPHLEAPAVDITAQTGRERRYLQTSPELMMKRLLGAGLCRIYQLAPAFRDGDDTPHHRPEFRLLEWYRNDADWTALMDDCEGLLRVAAEAAGCAEGIRYGETVIRLDRPFARVSVDAAFRKHAGFSILEALERDTLASHLTRFGIHFESSDGWDDLFHRVFLTKVEPALLAGGQPLFLTHYPAPLAALARLSPDDPRVAERFELYAGGLELANAFGELTDTSEQRQRFASDRELRQRMGRHDYPPDERFFDALNNIQKAAGIALGIERLLMLLLNAKEIDEVAFVPWRQS